MDSKASARAKHASSQRGRARHSTRKHPPQAPQQQQATSDHQQPREKKDLQLPSNWSRYEEEEEEEEEEEVSHFDIPPVKSKGANYKDLLAEKSMIQGPDLASGRKALMVTRGRDLWSQFMDMDNLWSVHEVSNDEDNFFTLDLDFLNKELAKLDMAQRLLLDAEYACLGEMEKSDRVHEIPEAETVDEDNTISTSPSRTSAVKSRASVSPRVYEHLDRIASTRNEEAGSSSVFEDRLLEMPGTTAKQPEDGAESFLNKESEIPDSNMHSVSKEPLAELAKSTNLFDAKSAEAELDALLDMLDNRTSGQAPVLMPFESFGSARGPVSAFQQACPDALKESSPFDCQMDSSDVATLNLDMGPPNTRPIHMMESTSSAVKVNNVSFQVPDVDTRKNVPSLDDDFDEWLDSL